MMRLKDFDYNLPKELIAKYPSEPRDSCRLLVLDRKSGDMHHRVFKDLLDYIEEGDSIIFNNSKVIPARLIGKKEKGLARIEIFLIRRLKDEVWLALIKNMRRLRSGQKIVISEDFFVEFLERQDDKAIVKLYSENVYESLKKYGHIPLPPYMEREDEEKDKTLYQTVFAKNEGSVACPTAGLHFTDELIEKIKEKGVNIGFVTLHVGLGTFKPIQTEFIEHHSMHEEFYTIPDETVGLIEKTRESGKSVIAVGTTVVRTLESFYRTGIKEGFTDIFIYPPYKFRAVDKIVTNFHLPKSTLLLLVSAFASKDLVLKAYSTAIEKKYRFYSYGDAMFII